MNIESRFLNYVAFNTTSDCSSQTVPSTPNQLLLAKFVEKELLELGLLEVKCDEYGYVYGFLPSNNKSNVTIGLLAHFDTSEDASGENVKPHVIENYDGLDIILNEKYNIVLSTKEFPELSKRIGHRLITTDGTTLLGADDKAGLAAIMDVLEKLHNDCTLPHPNLVIAFTPDEEIGRGTDYLNYSFFTKHNCKLAYTLDGDDINNINYENFNAATAFITINGKSIHPGSAKGKMVNSLLLAMEFNALLPQNMTPSLTEKYEGFDHLNYMEGEVAKTSMSYIIRNHDKDKFAEQKTFFKQAAEFMNIKYGNNTVELSIIDSYYNMKDIVLTNPDVLVYPVKALKRHNIDATFLPIRGGTDGARMTYNGVITPNLGTGGRNYHGPYEYLDITDLNKMVEVLITMLSLI